MKRQKIAVIGAGHVGTAVAAELILSGHEVALYEAPNFERNLTPIRERGGIDIKGIGTNGFAKVTNTTTNIGEAVVDAKIIIVATIANAHDALAIQLSPYLKNDQVIALLPGDFGSLVFAKQIEEHSKVKVKIGESISAPYGCRRHTPGKAEVTIHTYFKNLGFAAFPAVDTKGILAELEKIYPGFFIPAKNAAEVALGNPNFILHVGPILMMAGWIESTTPPKIWWDGLNTSTLKVMDAVCSERDAIVKKLNLSNLYPLERIYKIINDPECRRMFGPSDMNHRFITEDCPMGMVPVASLGSLLNVPTPLCNAFISLASEVNGKDYMKEGRNTNRLGIPKLNANDLNTFLEKGRV